MPADSILAEIALTCIGSDAFRAGRSGSFLRAVKRAAHNDLASWLTASHLGGLFAEAVREGADRDTAEVVEILVPSLRVQEVYHLHLLNELLEIGEALTASGRQAQVAMMKGISHWDYYKDGARTRRIRDLDLLVGGMDDGAALCDALEAQAFSSLQFEGDTREARAHLAEGGSFSAPPYRVRRRVSAPADVEAMLQREQGAGNGVEFQWMEGHGVVATVDVEIHTALFRTETGDLVHHRSDQLRPSRARPGFAALAPGPALAYAACKFSLDMIEVLGSGSQESKCLKLGADVVRILPVCRQADFDAAFDAATEWGCLHHLVDVLRAVAPLVPEIALDALPDPGGDTLFMAFLEQLPHLD